MREASVFYMFGQPRSLAYNLLRGVSFSLADKIQLPHTTLRFFFFIECMLAFRNSILLPSGQHVMINMEFTDSTTISDANNP
jgi:hypothetical protein